MRALLSMSPAQSSSIGHHTVCLDAGHVALCLPSVGSWGSSDSLNRRRALCVQDIDTTRIHEDASTHQELPEADASADAPTLAKEPADDPDSFTVPIQSISAATKTRTTAPSKTGMAKIYSGMACILTHQTESAHHLCMLEQSACMVRLARNDAGDSGPHVLA